MHNWPLYANKKATGNRHMTFICRICKFVWLLQFLSCHHFHLMSRSKTNGPHFCWGVIFYMLMTGKSLGVSKRRGQEKGCQIEEKLLLFVCFAGPTFPRCNRVKKNVRWWLIAKVLSPPASTNMGSWRWNPSEDLAGGRLTSHDFGNQTF